MSSEKPSALELFGDRWINGGLFGGWYREHVEQLGLKGAEKILDFGCGSGHFARFAAKKLKKGGQIVCLDTSKAWLDIAKKKLNKTSGIHFSSKSIQELEADAIRFDLVNISYVLHDIPQGERGNVVQSLVNILNPGGRLAISEPTRDKHGMSSWEIRAFMREAGLVEMKCRETKSVRGAGFFGIFKKEKVQ